MSSSRIQELAEVRRILAALGDRIDRIIIAEKKELEMEKDDEQAA